MEDLGPAWFTISKNGKDFSIKRTDFTIKNQENKTLFCSHFTVEGEEKAPCVVYLHGNCSCRLEALPLLDLLLPKGLSLCTFDFAGCGMSEGEYVSLGWHERDDLEIVIYSLKK